MTEEIIDRLACDDVPPDVIGDLRWTDIDWSSGAVVLRRPCAHRCLVGLTLGLPDSRTHRHRHVAPETLSALRSLRDREILRRLREGFSWYPSDPVVTTRSGSPIPPRSLIGSPDPGGVPHPHSPRLHHAI